MSSTEIPKAYEPETVEDRWYAAWLEQGCFIADPSSAKPPYSIVIPPPNVTGVLTMGHVLNNTIQDILARRKRMEGFEVLWLPGTDHAGIATQTVVEKALRKEKTITHRNDLGRERFLEKVWDWKEKHGGIIIQQLKKLGCSCDWSRERFTMDDHYSECVLRVFVELYHRGLIYRGKRMVNWDPAAQTALSDEEVIMTEEQGHLWHMKYPLLPADATPAAASRLPSLPAAEFITVATTRPETMLGDEAVAVHPDDERYRALIGRQVLLPLRNKTIPIIGDELVDPKFGTGCVKVTPAHDPADYEMGTRHDLPFTVVIGPDGRMTDAAGDDFSGLDRLECREAVVERLKEEHLLAKIEDYTHNVGYSERSHIPIEPYLSEQWFLKYPEVDRSTAAVDNGELAFYPERWTKTYTHWMYNIRDWCISRQLWWGHRIPVWYRKPDATTAPDTPAEIHVGLEPPADEEHWEQDPDVLDTWFSSWLWPFATMGWPEKNDTLRKFYPTSDLVTGPDIIFFWVARMIMAGYAFMDEKPFANVYYTGIIRDALGRKMSKSLGNSPDPLDLIATYGADGLRFGLMLIAPQGQDILFDEKRCEIGRNFMNKLWNAARFIQMLRQQNPPDTDLTIHDRKVLFELNHAIVTVSNALDTYRFNEATKELYDFVWGDFCDWYIEVSKTDPNLVVLEAVFNNILRLLHPFAPFITEELWHGMGYGKDTIQFSSWPQPIEKDAASPELAARVDGVYHLVRAGRQLRNDYRIEPQRKVGFVIKPSADPDTPRDAGPALKNLLGADEVRIDPDYEPATATPSAVTPIGTIFMVGAVDPAAERNRLEKQLADIDKQLRATNAKLENDKFVSRAAPVAVEREREKQSRLTEQREKVTALLAALD